MSPLSPLLFSSMPKMGILCKTPPPVIIEFIFCRRKWWGEERLGKPGAPFSFLSDSSYKILMVCYIHVIKPHELIMLPIYIYTYVHIHASSQCGEISQLELMADRKWDLDLIWKAITKPLFYQFHLEKTSTANMALPGKLKDKLYISNIYEDRTTSWEAGHLWKT